jgi:hypothetical protein
MSTYVVVICTFPDVAERYRYPSDDTLSDPVALEVPIVISLSLMMLTFPPGPTALHNDRLVPPNIVDALQISKFERFTKVVAGYGDQFDKTSP